MQYDWFTIRNQTHTHVRVPSRNFSLGGESNFHVHIKVISTVIVYLSMLTVDRYTTSRVYNEGEYLTAL